MGTEPYHLYIDTYAGTDSFTYTASDGSLTDSATVFIEVINQPPLANDVAYTAVFNTTLTVPAPGVLENDDDFEDDTLTAILVTNAGNGSVNLNGNGSFQYTPGPTFTGTTTFTYKANDGFDDSNIATVSLNVVRPTADIDTDSDNTGEIEHSQLEDDVEMEDPGKVIPKHRDNDNKNNKLDFEEPGPFTNANNEPMDDDDLYPIDLSYDSLELDLTGFKLELAKNGTAISPWKTRDKQALTLSYTIGTNAIPNLC